MPVEGAGGSVRPRLSVVVAGAVAHRAAAVHTAAAVECLVASVGRTVEEALDDSFHNTIHAHSRDRTMAVR